MRRTTDRREEWRRAVFRAGHITDGTRVLLLYLADHMQSNLQVSVARTRIAKDLGVSERRVSARLREAVGDLPKPKGEYDETEWLERCRKAKSLRLLDRRTRGQKHRQAEYVGLPPDLALSGTDAVLLNRSQGDETLPPEKCQKRPPENWAAEREPDISGGHTPSRLSKHDATCSFHLWDSCPEDCVNADRRSA